MFDFILEAAELLLSWRLYVGLAVTAGICWLIASWRWQVRADFAPARGVK